MNGVALGADGDEAQVVDAGGEDVELVDAPVVARHRPDHVRRQDDAVLARAAATASSSEP